MAFLLRRDAARTRLVNVKLNDAIGAIVGLRRNPALRGMDLETGRR